MRFDTHISFLESGTAKPEEERGRLSLKVTFSDLLTDFCANYLIGCCNLCKHLISIFVDFSLFVIAFYFGIIGCFSGSLITGHLKFIIFIIRTQEVVTHFI